MNDCCCLQVPSLVYLEDKWRSVYEHLEAAPSGNMGQIFLTYASGAGVFAHPRAVAKAINPQLYEYLQAKTDQNQRFGIICMDFPAAPIIQTIIDFQLKEVVKTKKTKLEQTTFLLRQMMKHFTPMK